MFSPMSNRTLVSLWVEPRMCGKTEDNIVWLTAFTGQLCDGCDPKFMPNPLQFFCLDGEVYKMNVLLWIPTLRQKGGSL